MRCTPLLLTLALSNGLVAAAPAPKCSFHEDLRQGRRPSLDEVKESFYKARIVPDVLTEFEPSSLLYLTYTSDSFKHKHSKVVLPGTHFAKDSELSPLRNLFIPTNSMRLD